jgi:hypothetical protein
VTAIGSGGAVATGGVVATGGSSGGGAGGASAEVHPDGPNDTTADSATTDGTALTKFSFFVTILGALRKLSGSQNGFGGDLRYGQVTGLAGADKLCGEIAETSMPGSSAKQWRAFLSTVAGPVHAIDRVGSGPWYDRMGRLVAMNRAALLQERPMGAAAAIINDLPNEYGIPNHSDGAPGCVGNSCPDNHDVLTGTGTTGQLFNTNPLTTCNDWTSAAATNPGTRNNGPRCGHSWPRAGSGMNWMSSLAEGGCGPGINLVDSGGPKPGDYTVGSGGGYGGFYCFALTP